MQGQCFDTEKLELHVWEVMGIVGYNFRTIDWSVTWPRNLDFFFQVFLLSLVSFTFYHSSWMSLTWFLEIGIKTINDFDPSQALIYLRDIKRAIHNLNAVNLYIFITSLFFFLVGLLVLFFGKWLLWVSGR